MDGQPLSPSGSITGAVEFPPEFPLGAPPHLGTARLRLVPPEPLHAAGLFSYGRKPEFTAPLHSQPFSSPEDATAFAQSLRKDNHSGKRIYWVAEKASDGAVVGTLGFIFPFPRHQRVAEFGYGFDPATWGTGLFQEAARAILAYGFGKLDLHRIQALTRSANARSINGVRKLGFRSEATLADFYQNSDGSRSDAVLLALLRPDF